MTTLKTNTYKALLIAAMTLAFTATAHSAAYIKFDGVDGESNAQPQPVVKSATRGTQGLLLPAVQQARQAGAAQTREAKKAPTRNTPRQAGDEHEIEYDIAAGV